MEVPDENYVGSSLIGIVLGGLVILAIVLGTRSNGKRRRLPPGPWALPIIGNLLNVDPAKPSHQVMTKLAEKHGPIMYLQLGSVATVVVSNSKMAKIVLKELDKNFASRPYLSCGKYLGFNFRSLVFARAGDYFQRIRKMHTVTLYSRASVERFSASRRHEMGRMLRKLIEAAMMEKPVDLTSVTRTLVTNILITMVCGHSGCDHVRQVRSEKLMKLVGEAMELVGKPNLADFFPLLRRFDVQGLHGEMNQVATNVKATSKDLIEECQSVPATDAEARLIDVLTSFEGVDKLTDEEIAVAIFDNLNAGTDTTSIAADWTIAELLRQPETLKKAQEEMDSVVGKERLVDESDIPNLPYLQCIVKECLRLHPPTPLGIPHMSIEDCEVGGYHIPANTSTLINIYAINRDAQIWENALKFDPDRFLNSMHGGDTSTMDFQFLTFSSGRRGCAGVRLGMTVLQFTIATLIQSFDYELAAMKPHELSMAEALGLVTARKGANLVCSLTPRLHHSVYNGNETSITSST